MCIRDRHIPVSCTVYCDGIWLVFILSQLLRNSAQYKKGDCGNITITAKERPMQVLLSVRDEGTGIPDNELSRIFEKGFTGSNGRKTKSSTGMGLYLSKKDVYKRQPPASPPDRVHRVRPHSSSTGHRH